MVERIGDVNVYETEDFDYVKFNEIPEEYQKEFDKWMYGQTCSMIDGELVAYVWDWERWYDLKTKGIPTYFD